MWENHISRFQAFFMNFYESEKIIGIWYKFDIILFTYWTTFKNFENSLLAKMTKL